MLSSAAPASPLEKPDRRFEEDRYKHWVSDKVRFSDLDPLGHVNNNAYGEYFENARAALFAILTPRWPWRKEVLVLAKSSTDFCRELHLPASFRIGTCVTRIGRSSLHIADALFADGHGIAYCESISVLIDQSSRKPTPFPEDVRERLLPYLDDEGTPSS